MRDQILTAVKKNWWLDSVSFASNLRNSYRYADLNKIMCAYEARVRYRAGGIILGLLAGGAMAFATLVALSSTALPLPVLVVAAAVASFFTLVPCIGSFEILAQYHVVDVIESAYPQPQVIQPVQYQHEAPPAQKPPSHYYQQHQVMYTQPPVMYTQHPVVHAAPPSYQSTTTLPQGSQPQVVVGPNQLRAYTQYTVPNPQPGNNSAATFSH